MELAQLLLPTGLVALENSNADALSQNPHSPSPSEGIAEGEMQIAVVRNRSTAELAITDITDVLSQEPQDDQLTDFASEQYKDPDVVKIINFVEDGILPPDAQQAKTLAIQGSQSVLVDNILCYVDTKNNGKRQAVVPQPTSERHSGEEWQVILL